MKAKIKATGEIIELCPYVYDIDGNDFLLEEVELLNNPNWQQARIQAAIASMDIVKGAYNIHDDIEQLVRHSVRIADALVAELKHSEDVYAECRRMDAINTAAMCENMAKIQKELQKKGGQNE